MSEIQLIAITYYTVMAVVSYVNNRLRKKITKEVTVSLEHYVELENRVKEMTELCKRKDAQIDFLMSQLRKEGSNSSNKSSIS
jgi:predicted RNase H-related nuclease YkuK (DUF458 family)